MNKFVAVPAVRSEEPLLLGIVGPPGGGKTLSSLRLAKGIQSVRGGDIVVIDTEGGRSRKYNDVIPFNIVEFPSGISEDFLEAIKAQLPSNPAAIIVDSMSDEHEAYLEFHDRQVPVMGGNDWAAWSKPKASRKKLLAGILKIKTPLIFTFRAREKTKQDPNARNKNERIVNIGWQPVAPLEIVHTLDLTCILPPRADGVPVWQSDKIGEDFIIKLPNYLAPYIEQGQPLNEQMGAAFARWAKGSPVSPRTALVAENAAGSDLSPAPQRPEPAASLQSAAAYYERWTTIMQSATNADQLSATWNDQAEERKLIAWTDEHPFKPLQAKVGKAISSMRAPA